MNIKELAGLEDFVGDVFVRATGAKITGRVVMCQYDANGIGFESYLKNLSAVHYSGCETANRDLANAQNTVGTVKQKDLEGLAILDIFPVAEKDVVGI